MSTFGLHTVRAGPAILEVFSFDVPTAANPTDGVVVTIRRAS